MNVSDAIKQRHSTRAFLDRAVSPEQIETILNIARYSPSGANTQPWHLAVVMGESKQRLEDALHYAFITGIASNPDYAYYPSTWQAPYIQRRKDCGLQLYNSLEISRNDRDKRQAQWAANYRAFDAPVMLLFFMDKVMETGSFLDYGMFLQSIMLAAMDQGLATCPQAALAEYPDIVKSTLGFTDDRILICGMALGYEDTSASVNQYRTPREALSVFTQWFN